MNLLSNETVTKYIGLPKDVADALRTAQGSEFAAAANQFLEALVNKLVYQRVHSFEFTNPFRKYFGEPIIYGDSIENVYVDKIMGRQFDRGNTDPFAKAENRVLATYAKLNYAMQYAVSVEDKELRKAVLNAGGFSAIADRLASRLGQSAAIDEYLAIIIMLNNENIYTDGFEELDVSGESTDADVAHAISKKIGAVYRDFKLPSIDNNKVGVMTASKASDILIIAKANLMNDLDYDYLAAVYNLSKAEIKASIMEVRSFMAVVNTYTEEGGTEVITPGESGDDIDFIIIDSRGLDLHDCLNSTESIRNPKGLYTNTFHNLWGSYSFNSAYQARAYKIKRTADAVVPDSPAVGD